VPRPAPRIQRKTKAGRIAIVGRANVGKSTLLNALLGEPIAIVSSHPQTTRDRIAGIVTRGRKQLVFLDTPGIHRAKTKLGARMNELARESLEEADVVVFMTDVRDPPRPRPSEEDLAILASIPEGKPVVLVLNKVDRLKNKALLLPVLETWDKARPFRAIVPMSARRADAVERLVEELEPLMPASEPLFEGDEISDKPIRFFVAEYVREQILRQTRDEVPHGVAVVVQSFDEALDIPVIELTVHVDKEAHKKILIGKKGAMMKSIGQKARERVERLLGKQVHLKLWVRVTPRWYENPSALAELGYGGS
jgi:GTP-binding protein Era